MRTRIHSASDRWGLLARHVFRPTSRCAVLVTIWTLFLWGAATAQASSASASVPETPRSTSVIVKYRDEGPHAVERCAERLSRAGQSFAGATRDHSDSLDRLARRLRLPPHRALLGNRRGESLEARRARLVDRFERRRAKRGRRGRARSGSADAARAARRMAALAHVYRIEVGDGQSAVAVAAELAADPHVEYAQPDHLHALDQTPFFDDPFLASSGSWGQAHADLWGPDRIQAPLVWSRTQGEGVVVAVVDSGLDQLHPDIADNVWVNPGEDLDGDGRAEPEDQNGIDDDGNGFIDDLTGFDFANSVDADEDGFYDGPEDVSDADPFDDRGHGTHVAGTIAAVADNGLGIVGIAPRAKIMALKGFGTASSAPDSLLWRAVLYAAENGADVVNNSWSCGTPCPVNPLAEEVLEIVDAMGLVVVTSAGNAEDDVIFRSPENGRHAITVGSIGVDDEISSFSNQGWLIDVVAPGGGPNPAGAIRVARRNILSLLSSGTSETEIPFSVAGDYYRLAGTSMSAPHVTGAVALLLSLRPELSPSEVRRLIRLSARDLGDEGRDPIFGPGLLDVAALVDEASPDLELTIASPRPTARHDPAEGALEIRGRANGADLESIEISIGEGIAARRFEPIESIGDSSLLWRREAGRQSSDAEETPTLARIDTSELDDGAYTIRLLARLVDGRVAQEFSVVGIERNRPLLISSGEPPDAKRPSISGRRVVWQQHQDPDEPIHDVYGAPFPRSASWRADTIVPGDAVRPVVLAEDDQVAAGVSGRELAWVTQTEDGNRIERCRWRSRQKEGGCDVEQVADGEGLSSKLWIAGRWIVWMRSTSVGLTLEGCRVQRQSAPCVPRVLVDPILEPSWQISSLDGETLLLGRRFDYATCRLDPEALPCTPEPIEFTSPIGFVMPFEPVHDRELIAFSQARNLQVLPPGCEPGDASDACRPSTVFSKQYHACWLDPVSRRCHEIQVSGSAAFAGAQGIAVSGRRIVWSISDAGERPSIRFCEFDPESYSCPEQRLTGQVASATEPDLDGARIVWEDRRLGPKAIWGFELPSLFVAEEVRVRAGQPFVIPVFGRAGTASSLSFEVEPVAGEPAELRIVSPRRGRSWARIIGRLPSTSAGPAKILVRAISDGGIVVERTIDLEIVPAHPIKRGNPALRPGRPSPG